MCGIFGFRISSQYLKETEVRKLIKDLFLLSESRGKEASGISLFDNQKLEVLKSPYPASDLY